MQISIHALREESDLLRQILQILSIIFQSTLSVRRATPVTEKVNAVAAISIHALREESDNIISTSINIRHDFNPRSP